MKLDFVDDDGQSRKFGAGKQDWQKHAISGHHFANNDKNPPPRPRISARPSDVGSWIQDEVIKCTSFSSVRPSSGVVLLCNFLLWSFLLWNLVCGSTLFKLSYKLQDLDQRVNETDIKPKSTTDMKQNLSTEADRSGKCPLEDYNGHPSTLILQMCTILPAVRNRFDEVQFHPNSLSDSNCTNYCPGWETPWKSSAFCAGLVAASLSAQLFRKSARKDFIRIFGFIVIGTPLRFCNKFGLDRSFVPNYLMPAFISISAVPRQPSTLHQWSMLPRRCKAVHNLFVELRLTPVADKQRVHRTRIKNCFRDLHHLWESSPAEGKKRVRWTCVSLQRSSNPNQGYISQLPAD